MNNNKNRLLTAVLIVLAIPARAGVLTVGSPSVTKGVTTVEIGNAYEPGHNGNGYHEHSFQISYGLTDYWKSGAEFTFVRPAQGELRYALTEWKNTFLLYKQSAAMPLSVGLRAEYAFARDRSATDDIDMRLLLQHGAGPLDLLGSIGAVRELGANRGRSVIGGFSGSVRYWGLDDGHLAPAIDYLGSTGRLSDDNGFYAQKHRAGPVLYGKFDNGFGFDAGYLMGISGSAPDHSLKLNVRYSF